MAITVTGFPGVTEVFREHVVDKNGTVTRIRWEGPEVSVKAFLPTVRNEANFLRYSFIPGPKSAVIGEFGVQMDGDNVDDLSELTTVWTLEGAELQQSIYNHPDVVALGVSKIAEIKKAVEDAVSSGTSTTTLTGDAKTAFELLVSGVEYFELSQYVLRRSLIVPAGYTVQAASANVNKVFTTAELTADESIPNTILFEMPAGEWKKSTPTIQQQQDGRFEVLNEWKHADSWSTFLYERKT